MKLMKKRSDRILKCVVILCLLSLTHAAWSFADTEYPSAVLIDTIYVDSTDIEGTDSTVVLEEGKLYWFVVSGTVTGNRRKNGRADAEYFSPPGSDWSTVYDGTGYQGYPGSGEDQMDLQINKEFVDWGEYNPEHVYILEMDGTGATVNFRIFDGDVRTGEPVSRWYGDNEGFLTVEIYELCDEYVEGQININPNNSASSEFTLTLTDGSMITRDDLTKDFAGYSGPASRIHVKPKGSGNQGDLIIDGQAYTLSNSDTYDIESDSMTVDLYNDKVNSKGKATGQWWINITARDATITVSD